MNEDEIWDALEELHDEERVEHVPDDGEPKFRLTDLGVESAEELIGENDDAAMTIVAMAIQDVERKGDPEAVMRAIVKAGRILQADAGVNVMRLLKRHPKGDELVDTDVINEGMIEVFES